MRLLYGQASGYGVLFISSSFISLSYINIHDVHL